MRCHTHTYGQFGRSNSPSHVFGLWSTRRKLHNDTGETCKLHIHTTLAETPSPAPEVRDTSANHCTTTPFCTLSLFYLLASSFNVNLFSRDKLIKKLQVTIEYNCSVLQKLWSPVQYTIRSIHSLFKSLVFTGALPTDAPTDQQ